MIACYILVWAWLCILTALAGCDNPQVCSAGPYTSGTRYQNGEIIFFCNVDLCVPKWDHHTSDKESMFYQ